MLQAERLQVQFPDEATEYFFNLSKLSSCTMALGFTQPLKCQKMFLRVKRG
jgi:hypothetical protein